MAAFWPNSGGKKLVKNGFHFLSSFGVGFGPKMVPKMVPTSIQNWFQNCLKTCHDFVHIFGGLGALQVPLGSLLGLPEPLLGGLWTPKTLKNSCFFWFFERHLFAALELLKPLWEPSWRARGRSETQNGAQKDPQNGPKTVQKWIPKKVMKRTPK